MIPLHGIANRGNTSMGYLCFRGNLTEDAGSTAQFFNASVIKTFYSFRQKGQRLRRVTLTLSEFRRLPVTLIFQRKCRTKSYTVVVFTPIDADGTASSNEVQTLTSDPNAAGIYTVEQRSEHDHLHVRMFSTFALSHLRQHSMRTGIDGGNADAGIMYRMSHRLT